MVLISVSDPPQGGVRGRGRLGGRAVPRHGAPGPAGRRLSSEAGEAGAAAGHRAGR